MSAEDQIKAMDPIERFSFEIMSLRLGLENMNQSIIVCNAMSSATHDIIKNTLGQSCPEIFKTNVNTTKAWHSIKQFVKSITKEPSGIRDARTAKGILERMERFEERGWIDEEMLWKGLEPQEKIRK